MENKTGKPAFAAGRYFKYAVGEIVLVVIGILIALSINNWNEDRKKRLIEIELLHSVAEDLKLNLEQFSSRIKRFPRWDSSSEIIISAMETKLIYSDTLDKHFHNARQIGGMLLPVQSGYQTLKNEGFQIVSNKSLKKKIVNLFELDYLWFLNEQSWFTIARDHTEIFTDENFTRNKARLKPVDYVGLKGNTWFKNYLYKRISQRYWFKTMLENRIERTVKLLTQIEEELVILNK